MARQGSRAEARWWKARGVATLGAVTASLPPSRAAPAEEPSLHLDRFRRRFGGAGEVRLFRSPGRVNLMGAHLDYNGGPVLPSAIDRGTFLALRPRADRALHLASTLEGETFSAALDELPVRAAGRWYDYPVGVLLRLLRDRPAPCGMDVLYGGNLPIGAGLSSSASICVGTAFAFDAVWELGGSTPDFIESALWGEREFVGVRCGIMDPYAVGYTRPGHLLWLDCKDASIEHLPLDAGRVAIAVADSGVRRELAKGEFNRRVAECARVFELLRGHVPGATCLRDVPGEVVEAHAGELDDTLLRRARHVAGEVQRTFAAREAVLRGDLAALGELVTATHASLRSLYEVSLPELDLLVEGALEWPGVLGARLTGAGFGGCVIALLERGTEPGFAERLAARFERSFGRAPTIGFYAADAGPREV